jgi:cyclopropane fatty-acyl-phospholipid synthase-like methyltransferase
MRNRYGVFHVCGVRSRPNDTLGNVARGLLPHVANVVGLDISQGMVDQFNTRVIQLGLPQHRIYATVKDLVRTPDDFAQQFDVVVVSAVPDHHIS